MNPFFRFNGHQEEQKLPARVYARLDDVHLPDAETGGGDAILRFDLVDADWLDSQAGNTLFDLRHPRRIRSAWTDWFADAERTDGNIEDPLAAAPLSIFETRIEFAPTTWLHNLGIPGNTTLEDVDVEITAAFRERWYELQVVAHGEQSRPSLLGTLHRSFFDEGVPVRCFGTLVSPRLAKALTTLSALAGCPRLKPSSLRKLTENVRAEYLAVYDVGQANANALLDTHFVHGANQCRVSPTLYFDLGMPVPRESRTAPATVRFCFKRKPPVVLSHWHDDHLCGAALPVAAGSPTAFEMNWIVPEPQSSFKHKAFVTSILAAGGHVYMFPTSPAGRTFQIASPAGYTLTLVRGTANDPNNSGIVMEISRHQIGRSRGKYAPMMAWLLPGDCDYKYFPSTFQPSNVVAVIAPHHGAKLKTNSSPVPPGSNAYRRLIYSFGRANSYSHPHQSFCDTHNSSGWNHVTTTPPGTVTCISGHDVRTTNVNLPAIAAPGGVVVGWSAPPAAPVASACQIFSPPRCVIPIGKH